MFRIFFAHSTFFTSFSEGNSRIVTYNGSTDAYISSNCMRSYQIVEAMPQPTNSSTLLLINKMSIDVIYEKCLIWKIIPNDICDIFDNFMSFTILSALPLPALSIFEDKYARNWEFGMQLIKRDYAKGSRGWLQWKCAQLYRITWLASFHTITQFNPQYVSVQRGEISFEYIQSES